MTLEEFKIEAVPSYFTTCNQWGFGGIAGYLHEFGIYSYFRGKRYYRHSNPTDSDEFRINGTLVSEKEFKESISKLPTNNQPDSYDTLLHRKQFGWTEKGAFVTKKFNGKNIFIPKIYIINWDKECTPPQELRCKLPKWFINKYSM